MVTVNKRIDCFFDGSFRGGKKGGSIGYIAVDAITGNVLTKWGKTISCKDSFESELRAFHQLLVHIRRHKKKNEDFRDAELFFYGDNKPLIDAINGECKMPVYSVTKDVLEEYKMLCNENKVKVEWIRREENRLADSVARCKNRAAQRIGFKERISNTYQQIGDMKEQIENFKLQGMIDKIDELDKQIRLNNCLISKILITERIKESKDIDKESLWRILEYYQREEFTTIRGKTFTYEIDGTYLKVIGIVRKINQRDILRVLECRPIHELSQIKHINGSSYIYAILKDARIGIQ